MIKLRVAVIPGERDQQLFVFRRRDRLIVGRRLRIDRNREKVRKELETLARNHTDELNGDTIVPASAIENGKQTFDVYRCINP